MGVAAYRIKDYVAARRHWEAAVKDDATAAMNNLGFLLYEGLGGNADPARAVRLWTRAAKRGHAEAAWHMGQAHQAGEGTGQSFVEAYAWYRCAAVPLAGGDETDAAITASARQSLTELVALLPPAQFGASEQLARSYIAAYANLRNE